MAALRRRRVRTGARPPPARGRQGLLRGPDSRGQPAIRRAARAIPLSRRSWPKPKRAASRRWPRSARPAESDFSAVDGPRHEDAGPAARQGRDPPAARRTVRPESVRRWGRMSAHQMVCHLSDALRMATGQKPVSPATGLLHRTIVKWIVLYLPLRWPAGILTRPEIDQELGGTRPVDFAADVAQLEALVELVTAQTRTFDWQAASDLRPDVGRRVAPLGLPPHRSPPSPVRVVGTTHASASRVLGPDGEPAARTEREAHS